MKYLFIILKHKWFFIIAGRKFGVNWLSCILHDWTKFLPIEFKEYKQWFTGSKKNEEKFAIAWLHHQNSNPHHWEYWVLRSNHSKNIKSYDNNALPMPEWAIREMVADWFAASRAYNGKWPDLDNFNWLNENRSKMIMHHSNQNIINKVLKEWEENKNE